MRFKRSVRWPSIDLYQEGLNGAIRIVSEVELISLMEKSATSGWSAVGRPEWFQQNQARFREAFLVVIGFEGPAVRRCIATVRLSGDAGGRFTLDVSGQDFNALPDVSHRLVVEFAHRYLGTFPVVELEGNNRAELSGENLWNEWGKS